MRFAFLTWESSCPETFYEDKVVAMFFLFLEYTTKQEIKHVLSLDVL